LQERVEVQLNIPDLARYDSAKTDNDDYDGYVAYRNMYLLVPQIDRAFAATIVSVT
jgi:hypothetical protein